MFSVSDVFLLCLCRSFIVDMVDVLLVAVISLCENLTLIVLLDSCTPCGGLEYIILT